MEVNRRGNSAGIVGVTPVVPSPPITAISNNENTAVINPLELIEGDPIALNVFGSNITQEYLESLEIKAYKGGHQMTEIAGTWNVSPDGDIASIDIIEHVVVEDNGNYVLMFAGKTITFDVTVS